MAKIWIVILLVASAECLAAQEGAAERSGTDGLELPAVSLGLTPRFYYDTIKHIAIFIIALAVPIACCSQSVGEFGRRLTIGSSLTYIWESNPDIRSTYHETTWEKNIAVSLTRSLYFGLYLPLHPERGLAVQILLYSVYHWSELYDRAG